MDLLPIVGALAALAGLAVLAGGVWIAFKGAADKATQEAQGRLLVTRGQEIEDLTRRVGLLESELEQSHAREQGLLLAVAQVRGIDTLQADVTTILSDTRAIRMKVGA